MKTRFSWKQIVAEGRKVAWPIILFFLTIFFLVSIIRFSYQNNQNNAYRWGIEQLISAVAKSFPNDSSAQTEYLQKQANWAILLDKFFQDKFQYHLNVYQKKNQSWEFLVNWGTMDKIPILLEEIPESCIWRTTPQTTILYYPIRPQLELILHTSIPNPAKLRWAICWAVAIIVVVCLWLFFSWPRTESSPSNISYETLSHTAKNSQKIYASIQNRWQEYMQKRTEKRLHITETLGETLRISNNAQQGLKDTITHLGQIHSSIAEHGQKIKDTLSALVTMSTAMQSVVSHASVSVNTSVASEGDAKKGGEVVSQIIRHMNKITQTVSKSASVIKELHKHSDKIVDITNVIDDIADQTNLLALNAAIEAARAGAQGRGFAVVADQVRSLAEKTTHATKEISETLSSIQDKTSQAVAAMDEGIKEIDMGAGLAVQAGVSLRRIVTNAKRITEMISSIVDAAQKQAKNATSSAEIMGSIDQKMDINCSLSQESVIIANNLANQIQEMAKCLENFRMTWEEKFIEQELISLFEASHNEWQALHSCIRISS